MDRRIQFYIPTNHPNAGVFLEMKDKHGRNVLLEESIIGGAIVSAPYSATTMALRYIRLVAATERENLHQDSRYFAREDSCVAGQPHSLPVTRYDHASTIAVPAVSQHTRSWIIRWVDDHNHHGWVTNVYRD
jgi:hypothetical protein